jgi:hypothetical protein
MKEPFTIVIAKAERTKLVPTGQMVMRDRNYFPEFELEWEGKACVWVNEGTREDLRKAEEYACREGWTVFCFLVDKSKALAIARRRVELAAGNVSPDSSALLTPTR